MRRRRSFRAIAALFAVAGCGRGAVVPVAAPTPAACVLDPPPAAHQPTPDTVVIAVTASDVSDPAGLSGLGLPFRVFYQTLVTVDCDGHVAPGLAHEWQIRDGGREWLFHLRADARFWDGVPVTAAEVRAAWLGRPAATVSVPWEGTADVAVRVEGDDALSVRLGHALADPALFADPALAVAKRAPGGTWPIGSGAWWPVQGEPLTATPVSSRALPTLRFVRQGSDARDLIDAGVDFLVTADPAALGYAAVRPDTRAVPLPWDRVYVLLSPSGLTVSDSARAALARDAVRVDARPAPSLSWWDGAARCGAPPAAMAVTRGGARPFRIVYPRGDAVAGDLAGRLVALGRAGPGGVAAGLSAAELAAALREGAATAFVIPLPARALDPCGAATALYARAPWLTLGDGFRDPIVPLVATRRHAVLRGPLRWTVGWDGVPQPEPRP